MVQKRLPDQMIAALPPALLLSITCSSLVHLPIPKNLEARPQPQHDEINSVHFLRRIEMSVSVDNPEHRRPSYQSNNNRFSSINLDQTKERDKGGRDAAEPGYLEVNFARTSVKNVKLNKSDPSPYVST
jgi:hypothetical protein